VGFDLLPSTLELIDEGVIQATIGQAPERQSYEAVSLLIKAINGDAIGDVDTGVEIVNADNIAKYLN
jgi:simple sugar transport system substrate-binding protein